MESVYVWFFFFFLSTIFPNHAKFEQTFTFRRMGIPCLFWPYVNYRWLICALILFEPLYNSCICVLNSCFSPSTEFINIFRFYAVETLPFSLWSDYIFLVWSFWKHLLISDIDHGSSKCPLILNQKMFWLSFQSKLKHLLNAINAIYRLFKTRLVIFMRWFR